MTTCTRYPSCPSIAEKGLSAPESAKGALTAGESTETSAPESKPTK